MHFDLKKFMHFDDATVRPYNGPISRYNLTLSQADAAELNGISEQLGISPTSIVREAIRLFELAFYAEPDVFFSESQRCKARQIDRLTMEMHDVQRRGAQANISRYMPEAEPSEGFRDKFSTEIDGVSTFVPYHDDTQPEPIDGDPITCPLGGSR